MFLLSILTVINLITSSPGQNAAKEVGLNWHCTEPGSYVELTSANDRDFKKAASIKPEEEKWKLDSYDSLFNIERYVCRVNLKELKPNTSYAFRVVSASEKSDIRYFTTAAGPHKKNWKFLAFCDFQTAFNENTHPLLRKLREMADQPHLAVCSGDWTDYGARQAEWEWVFGNEATQNILLTGGPGDHEYWSNGKTPTKHIVMMNKPNGLNAIFNNPKNGYPGRLNSSFWFIYNNILFVILDMGDSNTVKSDMYNEEVEWLKKTIPAIKEKHDYIVVLGHKSIYGSYTTDAGVVKYMRPVFEPAFKEVGVDLFIGGHDHMYSRTHPIDGVTYLDLGSSGRKFRTPDDGLRNDGHHEKVLDFKASKECAGAIISVSKKGLEVEVRNKEGKLLDSFTVN